MVDRLGMARDKMKDQSQLVTATQSGFKTQFERVARALVELNGNIGELENQFNPILRQVPPSVCSEKSDKMQPASEFERTMDEIICSINGMSSRIMDIIERSAV